MKLLYSFLDFLRAQTRRFMKQIAKGLHVVSRGNLTPSQVTLFGMAMHLPIALLIAYEYNWLAAVLLVVFGLFDTLDGELARLQNRVSIAGMLLDASTDRIKEVFLYSGVAYALMQGDHPGYAFWAVTACGFSICVSYVKAKGEMAISDTNISANEKNRLFQDGLLRFEVRMAILVIGLLINQLLVVTIIIAVLSAYTATERLIKISRRLRVQD